MLSDLLKQKISEIYTDEKNICQYYSCFIIENNHEYSEIQDYIMTIHKSPFKKITNKSKFLLTKAYCIFNDYVNNMLSVHDISDKYNIGYGTLLSFLNALGILRYKNGIKLSKIYNKDKTYKNREGKEYLCSKNEIKFRKLLENIFNVNDIIIQKSIISEDKTYYHSSDFYIKSLNLVIEYDEYPTHNIESDRIRNESITKLGYKLLIITGNMVRYLNSTSILTDIFQNLEDYLYPATYYISDEDLYNRYNHESVKSLISEEGITITDRMIINAYECTERTESIYGPHNIMNEVFRRIRLSKSMRHDKHPRFYTDITYNKILEIADGFKSLDQISKSLGVKRNCIIERIRTSAPKNYKDHLKWMAYYCPDYDRMNYTSRRHKYIIQELGLKDMGMISSKEIIKRLDKLEKFENISEPDVIKCTGYSRNRAIAYLEKVLKISLTKFTNLYNEGKKEEILKITRIDPSLRFNYELK